MQSPLILKTLFLFIALTNAQFTHAQTYQGADLNVRAFFECYTKYESQMVGITKKFETKLSEATSELSEVKARRASRSAFRNSLSEVLSKLYPTSSKKMKELEKEITLLRKALGYENAAYWQESDAIYTIPLYRELENIAQVKKMLSLIDSSVIKEHLASSEGIALQLRRSYLFPNDEHNFESLLNSALETLGFVERYRSNLSCTQKIVHLLSLY